MSRVDEIRDRLVTLMGHLQVPVSELSKDEWLDLPVAPDKRFGWMPPVRADDGTVVVLLSPELIAEVTEPAAEIDRDTYLRVVEATLCSHIWRQDEGPDQVERYLINELFSMAPGALRVWSELEALALDSGTITRH